MPKTITRVSSPPSSTVYGDQSNCACWPGRVSNRSVALLDGTTARSRFKDAYSALADPR